MRSTRGTRSPKPRQRSRSLFGRRNGRPRRNHSASPRRPLSRSYLTAWSSNPCRKKWARPARTAVTNFDCLVRPRITARWSRNGTMHRKALCSASRNITAMRPTSYLTDDWKIEKQLRATTPSFLWRRSPIGISPKTRRPRRCAIRGCAAPWMTPCRKRPRPDRTACYCRKPWSSCTKFSDGARSEKKTGATTTVKALILRRSCAAT